ncbi:LAGLIDADG family homing endonuclease [Halogeometricum limi]|uniref:DNA helicase n=1 Tax=Halogeometricum limi TaxID=555875 RepID=A0A1I6FV52_9EURY|nr:LAGLIDADG family homing endonuclease [Halogeometricum limi]SFR33766.1 intein C-terminal splicing region/intein N-terminal splicing region [Halogeometricum limi]
MAQAPQDPDVDLTERFIQFYRKYYSDDIGRLAQRYPNEQRSLYVDYDDLFRFDEDLAEDYRKKPDQIREYAEEALRLYDLPVDVKLGRAHVRLRNLPESVDIRNIRVHDDHIGRMVSVQGIVRKATDVRPKITEAAFECQRCGTMTYIPQTDSGFQEPHECQGCERQGPFHVDFDQSEFVDSQKLRVQESPEGLRGGETPQSIDIDVEDDITGRVTAGDHVVVTGVLHIEQQTSGQEKTPIFDLYMDGVAIEIEDEEFEDMDISEEDVAEIVELSNEEDIYDMMVGSVAPSIYGYEQEKLAMILQLFSGVTKHLPDGSRIRGDLHMLLIGDPGTGKSQMLSYIRHIAPRSVYTSGKGSSSAGLCVTGDTRIHTEDGFREIRDLALDDHPDPVSADESAEKRVGLQTFDRTTGTMAERQSSHVWRMPKKPCRRIETAHGKGLTTSENTPVLTCGEHGLEWVDASDVEPGQYVAVPKYGDLDRSEVPVRTFLELTTEKVRLADDSVERLRSALCDRFGHLRAAASELDLSEDFVYDSLRNRHVPLSKLDRILDAVELTRDDVDFDRAMLRHGDSIALPETFDEDLMYLLGLVFGDGDISLDRRGGNRGLVRLSNGDEALLARAQTIFADKFDKRPEIERQEGRVPCIRVNSATIARLFANAGMQTPKVGLELASELTTAAHADAFLRGFMDADGSVSARDGGGSSVLVSTISESLAEQVQLMLETYGVRARRRERDRRGTYELEDGRTIESKHVQHFVEMYGANIERYAAEIGFDVEAKREALGRITNDAKRREERVPVGSALLATDGAGGDYHTNVTRDDDPGRGRAREIIETVDLGPADADVREVVEADLRWDRVVDTESVGEKEVFDLTVPETHNFVGNGIVTHNTAAAVRDDFGDGQQWTLEAGALVLADKGIAAVDELDKMRCVTGETLVHLADGRVVRIGELAHEASEAGAVEALPNGRTIRDVDAEAWTMTEDGRVVERPVTAIHEYDAPDDLTQVTLQSGERLTAVHDHPFFVFEDGERVEKPATDVAPGEWVYVPRHLSQRATDGGVAAADSPVETNDSTASADGVDESDALSPAFGAVLGYLSGDGNVYYDREAGVYGVRFTNKEEQLLSDFERACRDAFDATPIRPSSEKRNDGVETVRLPGREYADAVVDAGMNLEVYDEKAFPTAVSASSTATKAAFVRAMADSEGTVDTDTGNVKISSSSYELLAGIKSLLLEFDVTTQIQHRERDGKRDLFVLAITAADSLRRFEHHVGFTLSRKQSALEAVCESASGDRTVLDVIPNCGPLLSSLRDSLRLYVSECGLADATYCNFENGDANVSLSCARTILRAFEHRASRAESDAASLATSCGWETLSTLRERYHVSQSELANGTTFSQQQVSNGWGTSDALQTVVTDRLHEIIESVAATNLEPFEQLVRGDVKWRRVESVETVDSEYADDRIGVLTHELADHLGVETDAAVARARTLLDTEPSAEEWGELRAELERHGVSFADVARDLDVAASTVSRWFNGVVETDRFDDVAAVALARISTVRSEVRRLLDAIESRSEAKVYDLTVEGTHNFVANGMVVHNSEDRSAMHEALEQQQISVSKAGINATLKSRCSLLGAANPKYGRFDQYEPIGEQIDLEPALISRFDLIFTVTDDPDPETDAALADHILNTNYAGELHTQRTKIANSEFTEEEVNSVTEEVAPAIDAELLRKYIAYSKRNCYPTMTDEAKQIIRDFYVNFRAKGADDDSPVPVTARKLEALVRLSEASARVRLSDKVMEEDAVRVTNIVESCLRDIGMDPETGEFDADIVETGTSKNQRDRIKNLKQLISDIEDEYEEGAPVEEVIARATTDLNLDETKAEQEIENLRRKGEVYEPRTDHLRTT